LSKRLHICVNTQFPLKLSFFLSLFHHFCSRNGQAIVTFLKQLMACISHTKIVLNHNIRADNKNIPCGSVKVSFRVGVLSTKSFLIISVFFQHTQLVAVIRQLSQFATSLPAAHQLITYNPFEHLKHHVSSQPGNSSCGL